MHTATEFRPLAPRQAEALTHRARGLSNRETAQAMRCSVTNVSNLLAECFYKLHARNSTDAVAKAVKHGLIQFILIACIINGIGADQEQIRNRLNRRPTVRTIRIRNRENLA
ncbi:LuxR C-terminal-related transcriptional regulator [Microbulbifer sp. OS29]|uniref:LuxR C-terminal-related transcriptional regulator n=1 Tax=Microbulbifer okhotskensis TaxID=2926617 RepID=A0A9X2EQR7_9GAMM|nr:LuxR C-terminal-related transcriptional regulator [Microbulbifer okhotskensis]MCO1336647.1 LuxR C-terminal-related transcriptional regulator [Microbulbifer okhotskensis]